MDLTGWRAEAPVVRRVPAQAPLRTAGRTYVTDR